MLIAGVAVVPALPLWTGSAFDASGVDVVAADRYSGVIRAARVDDRPQAWRFHRDDVSIRPRRVRDRTGLGPPSIGLPWRRAVQPPALEAPGHRRSSSAIHRRPRRAGSPWWAGRGQGAPGTQRSLRDRPRGREPSLSSSPEHLSADRAERGYGLDAPRPDAGGETSRGSSRSRGLSPGQLATIPCLRRAKELPAAFDLSTPSVELEAIPYSTPDRYRIHIGAGVLKKGDVLVLNHPFDSKWRASGMPSGSVEPGPHRLSHYAMTSRSTSPTWSIDASGRALALLSIWSGFYSRPGSWPAPSAGVVAERRPLAEASEDHLELVLGDPIHVVPQRHFPSDGHRGRSPSASSRRIAIARAARSSICPGSAAL